MLVFGLIEVAASVTLVAAAAWIAVLDWRNRKLRGDVAMLYKTNGMLLNNLKESFATNEILIERCVNLSIEMRSVRDSLRARTSSAAVN